MSGKRLTTRDYKRARHSQFDFDFARWRDLGLGLAVGLCVAGVVYVSDHRAPEAPPAEHPVPRRASADVAAASSGTAGSDAAAADGTSPAEAKYDFYHMLPKFEVVVPEKEKDVHADAKSVPETRRGTYVLQAGSYRNFADADRVRAQLALLGVQSKVQQVPFENDIRQRVRIGPISKLDELNRLRQILRKAEIDVQVIRVGD